MSATTLSLAVEASNLAPASIVAADGIINWATTKNAQLMAFVRVFVITIAVIFVVVQMVASKMAIARVVVSGLTAALAVWMVWNVTDNADRVNQEVNSAPAAVFKHDPISSA